MKRFFYFSAVLLVVLSMSLIGCRKEEAKEHPSNYYKFSSDCTNGIQDGDETGVDCGGNCEPCETVDLSCNMSNNTFEYVASLYNTFTGSMSFGESNLTVIGGGTFHIDFGSDPTSSGIYTATEFSTGSGYFTCYFIPSGSGSVYYSDNTSGNVMVTVSGSNINVEFCDLLITANGGSSYKNISGNINFN
jgi:hypothetical protein